MTNTLSETDWLKLDAAHVLHPCVLPKSLQQEPPLLVTGSSGCYLHLQNGDRVLDAISSWWCKAFGHQHPRLKAALIQQLESLEHVIGATTSHPALVRLSAQLATLMPGLSRAFYASDGSSAVEIAMKMSIHARMLRGETERTRFIALQNGYHGETLAALSVSDLGLYKAPYEALLLDVLHVGPLAYVSGCDDPLWQDASAYWEKIETVLRKTLPTATALILEPILQGAAGMRIYSADLLRRIVLLAREYGVHVIADEIMTGFGRTGKMLACEWADIVPDLLCLGKGLTGGMLPFSAVLMNDAIAQVFVNCEERERAFLHSHTYSGHALGAAVASEVMTMLREDDWCAKVFHQGHAMRDHFIRMNERLTCFDANSIRGLGGVVAAEVNAPASIVSAICERAVQQGVLLRPLGRTLYWCPPFVMTSEDLAMIAEVTEEAIQSINF